MPTFSAIPPVHVIGGAGTGTRGELRDWPEPVAGDAARWDRVAIPGHPGTDRPYGFLAGREDPFDALDRALAEALTEAGLSAAQRRDAPVILGTSSLDIARDENRLAGSDGNVALDDARWGRMLADICTRHDLGGPQYTLTTACSSSANALLYAQRILAVESTTPVIVLGFEGFNRITLGGFHSLMLLSEADYRPFDNRRTGIILAEGVAAAVIARDDNRAIARIDGGHTAIDPSGVTVASRGSLETVMDGALATLPGGREAIEAIKAHGTGTEGNDSAEAAAIEAVFRDAPRPYFSIKGSTGHTMGACCLVELLILIRQASRGRLPASTGFEEADPALAATPLQASRPYNGGRLLLNYFGFGGNNTCLVVSL